MKTICNAIIIKDVNFGGRIGILPKGTQIAITGIVTNTRYKSNIACECILKYNDNRTFFSVIDLLFIVEDTDVIDRIKYFFEKDPSLSKTILRNKLNSLRYGL